MGPFGELYERLPALVDVPAGLPLVITLTGFTDAGGAASQMHEYFRDEVQPEPLVVFNNDILLDYRARRPLVYFDQDHLTAYRPATLTLALAEDGLGQQFLVLSGYEPDFGWETFADTIVQLAEELEVSSATWVHAIPMPVPHTRPIGMTVSGNRRDLINAHSAWRPHTQVPATAGHLLELRLSDSGLPVAGFVLLVPHYLGDTEHPGVAVAALEAIGIATGLSLTRDELRAASRDFLTKIQLQIEGNDELNRMVHGLEERYDSYMAGTPQRSTLIADGDLPSADELAAELERFLASNPFGDEDPNKPPQA